jgi:phage-related protein
MNEAVDVREKPLAWVGSSLEDLRGFPGDARRHAGFQLRRLQAGLDPIDWTAMPTIGAGAREVRIHVAGAHRVFYVAHFPEAVYVLHAFEKRGRKTARGDVALGRERYRQMLAARRRSREAKK